MKSLIGLIHPTRGQVLFDEHDLAHLTDRELTQQRVRFGFVFQGAALFDSLSQAGYTPQFIKDLQTLGSIHSGGGEQPLLEAYINTQQEIQD